MSFVLPRNAPTLTFRGGAMGSEQRPREPLPLSANANANANARDVYAVELPTPYLGARPQMPAARPPIEGGEDDITTLAMGRASIERSHEAPRAGRAALPVFNLRRAVDAAVPALTTLASPRRRRPASLRPIVGVLGLMAAILAGMASLKYAPDCLDGVKAAARVFERR